jgi:hypothetical protein
LPWQLSLWCFTSTFTVFIVWFSWSSFNFFWLFSKQFVWHLEVFYWKAILVKDSWWFLIHFLVFFFLKQISASSINKHIIFYFSFFSFRTNKSEFKQPVIQIINFYSLFKPQMAGLSEWFSLFGWMPCFSAGFCCVFDVRSVKVSISNDRASEKLDFHQIFDFFLTHFPIYLESFVWKLSLVKMT